MNKRIIAVTLGVVLLVAAVCWWKASGQQPCNVVFITIDTLRADRLGCYGYTQAQTPHIDRLAQEGVRYARFHSHSPLTLPSHASLFTGTNPSFHGIRDNNWFRLRPDIPTLASIVQEYGYRTAAVVSSTVLARDKGMARGFAEYDDVPAVYEEWGESHNKIAERRAEESVRLARQQLKRFAETPDTPFLLWLHLFDPHAEYDPPAPFREKFADHLYDGEVAYVDHALGQLLADIRTQTSGFRTLIVFTADHGEGLGEHGEMSHGYFLYNTTLHIPLIFHCPGLLPTGERVDTPMRAIDLLPTLLSLLRIDNHGLSQGKDLSASVRAPSQVQNDASDMPAYAETYFSHHAFGWRPLHSITLGDYKYVDSRRGELYHLATDAGELRNLLREKQTPEMAAMAKNLHERMERLRAETQGTVATAPETGNSALATLGYHSYPAYPGYPGPTPAAQEQTTQAPDPADMVEEIGMFVQAQTLLSLGRDAQAIPLFEKLLQHDPGNITAMALLGKLYGKQNMLEQSLACFRDMHKRRPHLKIARDAVIDTLIRMQRLPEAADILARELAANKHDGILLSRFAYLKLSEGRYVEAAAAAQQASVLEPQLPSAWFYLGCALMAEEKWGAAADALARGLIVRNPWPEAEYRLATSLAKTGQTGRARQVLAKALATAPPEWRARLEEALSKLK